MPAQHDPKPRVGTNNSRYVKEKIEFVRPLVKLISLVALIRLGGPRRTVSMPSSRYGFAQVATF